MRVHVTITVCKKSPAEAAVAMWADKCQEVVGSATRSSLCPHLRDCLGELETVLRIQNLLIRIRIVTLTRMRIMLFNLIRIRIRLFDTDPDPVPYRFKEVMYLKQYFLYIFT